MRCSEPPSKRQPTASKRSVQASSLVATARVTCLFTRRVSCTCAGSHAHPAPLWCTAAVRWNIMLRRTPRPLPQSDLHSEGFRSLREGETVEFGLDFTPDGRQKAVNVTGPSGEFVQASRNRVAVSTAAQRASLGPPQLRGSAAVFVRYSGSTPGRPRRRDAGAVHFLGCEAQASVQLAEAAGASLRRRRRGS